MVSNILALFPLWAILASIIAYLFPAGIVDYSFINDDNVLYGRNVDIIRFCSSS